LLAPPPPPELPPPSALALEAGLLKRAVLSLRRGAPANALVDLDGYFARFPGGVLQREARVARVDALLALGSESEALDDLEQLAFTRHGRDQELQTIRGELRARRNCATAIVDFTAVLAGAAPAALAERALWGRATCRLRARDQVDAAADLKTYVRRFPQGRHVNDASRLLAGPK
jgi:hypothetical protein